MRVIINLLILALVFSGGVLAQGGPDGTKPQGENLKIPEGWQVRLDQPKADFVLSSEPDSGDIYFVNMTPGWHITTGPRAIFYHKDNIAKGNFKLESTIYLFDTKGRDREAYGLFIGGTNLDNDEQKYIYFLLRNTGEFLVKERMGTETETIQGWTATDAMVKFEGDPDTSAKNDFQLSVEGDQIIFSLNGTKLTSISTEGVQTGGIYGLRVNHSINLHVSSLILTNL